jgi:hypothetical protein
VSFLLDTDICSAYVKGDRTVFGRFLQYLGQLHVSVATLGELWTWALFRSCHGTGRKQERDILRDKTLEQRDARLGQRLDELTESRGLRSLTPTREWRRTVGMFRGDPIMKEVIDCSLRLREVERRLAHEKEARDFE